MHHTTPPSGGPRVDVVVAGLGAAGSAALYHLARQGARVLGVDPWSPPHSRGSTHGPSRIHRRAYMEGPVYLPLLERAEALWLALEAECGRTLLRRTGALMLGAGGSPLLEGAERSALEGDIPCERLHPAALARRYPSLALPPGFEGLLEPGAGVLDPEACVAAHLAGATEAGAEVSTGEALLGWEATPAGVRVRTGRREVQTGALVLALGPWLPALLAARGGAPGDLGGLEVERQVTGHFTVPGRDVRCLPVLLLDRGDEPLLYVVPETDGTLKAGLHHGGERAGSPAGIRREPLSDDEVRIALPLAELVPGTSSRWSHGSVCLYTRAPGERWLVGALPGNPGVFLASACSGHGFKASAAVGEAVAALARGERPAVDLSPFDPVAAP